MQPLAATDLQAARSAAAVVIQRFARRQVLWGRWIPPWIWAGTHFGGVAWAVWEQWRLGVIRLEHQPEELRELYTHTQSQILTRGRISSHDVEPCTRCSSYKGGRHVPRYARCSGPFSSTVWTCTLLAKQSTPVVIDDLNRLQRPVHSIKAEHYHALPSFPL